MSASVPGPAPSQEHRGPGLLEGVSTRRTVQPSRGLEGEPPPPPRVVPLHTPGKRGAPVACGGGDTRGNKQTRFLRQSCRGEVGVTAPQGAWDPGRTRPSVRTARVFHQLADAGVGGRARWCAGCEGRRWGPVFSEGRRDTAWGQRGLSEQAPSQRRQGPGPRLEPASSCPDAGHEARDPRVQAQDVGAQAGRQARTRGKAGEGTWPRTRAGPAEASVGGTTPPPRPSWRPTALRVRDGGSVFDSRGSGSGTAGSVFDSRRFRLTCVHGGRARARGEASSQTVSAFRKLKVLMMKQNFLTANTKKQSVGPDSRWRKVIWA